jgi:hypothetical protein
MNTNLPLGLEKEYVRSVFFTFDRLKDLVYEAEHVCIYCLDPISYRNIAELDGYGVKPEVEDLLKRAEAVREKRGKFFPDLEETLDALEQGRKPLTWGDVHASTLQAICNHSVCANRVKNCPDNTEFQQALVKALDWRARAERLLEAELAKSRDADRAQFAMLEQAVLDAERGGSVLEHETYKTIAEKTGSSMEYEILLKRAEAVRERDGLFFRNLEGTIIALESGKLELTVEQLYALSIQADCNLYSATFSRAPFNIKEVRKAVAESLEARATRLFMKGTDFLDHDRENAREADPASASSAAHLSSRSAPDNDGL